MLVKALGLVDLIVSIILILLAFRVALPAQLLVVIIIILCIKGISVLSWDLASFFDIFAALMLLLSIFFNVPVALLIISFFLSFQKGVVSLL